MRKIMTLRWCAMFVILLLTVAPAQAQQTRAYGPDGRSLGTASPYGNGSTRSTTPAATPSAPAPSRALAPLTTMPAQRHRSRDGYGREAVSVLQDNVEP